MDNQVLEVIRKRSSARAYSDEEVANHTIRRMKGKCIRKNILIAGLLWFGFVSCKMVNEAEKQRKEADERAREAEATLAQMTLQKEKDV